MISDTFRATWSPRLFSILRIIAGLMFMQHGLSKYFGFPAVSPPGFHALGLLGVAGVIEIVCGGLVAIGLQLSRRPHPSLPRSKSAAAAFAKAWDRP